MRTPRISHFVTCYLIYCICIGSVLSFNKKQPTPDSAVAEPKFTPTNGGEALRIGIVGLVHTHVHGILGREDYGDIEIVGIVESNRALAQRYSEQHGYPMDLVYNTIEEMVAATKPEAVTCFNTTYDHLAVVKYCAPRGIHVMVEKPMAVNLDHAEQMVALAKKHNIYLLTNYETTWYPSTAEAYRLVHEEKAIGDIRKIIFYTGHPGPKEIGCNEEFLAWLTDPVLNGGGALMDFGCYGANLATWLMKGAEPTSISCDTQHIKPTIYPKVEDDATIVLNYPKTQVIIMASWNWPHNRKEMEIYGTQGYVLCRNGTDMAVMRDEKEGPITYQLSPITHIPDPFAYLTFVIKEGYKVEPWSPSSMENNLVVMKVLEGAKNAING